MIQRCSASHYLLLYRIHYLDFTWHAYHRRLPNCGVENVIAQGLKQNPFHFYLSKFLPECLSLSYTFPPVLLFFQSISRLCPQLVVLQDFADLFASFAVISILLLVFPPALWKWTLSSALWSSALREKNSLPMINCARNNLHNMLQG